MTRKVGVVHLVIVFIAIYGFRLSVAEKETSGDCSLSVWPRSILYFDSELTRISPHFVHFQLEFNTSTHFNTTSDVFKPRHWVWTYKSHFATHPYMSWNIDYGLLSFGLLDSHTLDIDFVKINVHGDCNLTLGEYNTSMMIAGALTDLVKNFSDGRFNVYDSNEFCYTSFDENVKTTWYYLAAIYFNYPITYLGYMCCHVMFNYSDTNYFHMCDRTLQPKWEQSMYIPYWLGLFLFMYCPIILFQVSAWLVKDDPYTKHVDVDRFSVNDEDYQDLDHLNDKWIFLNGDSPIGITSFMQVILCNLSKRHPIVMSRIRRTLLILLTPSIIHIQLAMYKNGIGITNSKISVRDLVKRGVPMGFLSLLADKEDQNKVFAPAFGGALFILIMFHLQGFIFIIVPRSLNLIVERGMPMHNLPSPLSLDVEDIISMSMCRIVPAPGYEKGYAVLRLVFHLAAVILLVAATLEITSKVATGTTNEISEVMHVIFIVTVGALPRILEVALMNARESVVRNVEEREVESSILEYWNKEIASTIMNHEEQLP
ncbi:hypothetical protein ACF0H5_005901 [Mactra antiquata]